MKNFRSQFTQTTKALLLALVFSVALVAGAADWTPPTANPPQNNAPAPINVSTAEQIKGDSNRWIRFLRSGATNPAFWVSSSTGDAIRGVTTAGGQAAGVFASSSANNGFGLLATGTGVGGRGALTYGLANIGNADFLGGNVTAGVAGTIPPFNSGSGHYQYEINSWFPAIFHGRPITVDLASNLPDTNGSTGRDVFKLIGSESNDQVGIDQNKPWFFLWENSPGVSDRAGLRAKGGDFSGHVDAQSLSVSNDASIGNNLSVANNIRIGGGGPKPASVLTSIDDQGNAQWSSVSSLLDIKYVTHVWGGLNSGNFGDMQCPQGYVAISANCDCESGLDACIIAQLNGQNDAVSIPDNATLSVNWGSSDPHPDWVTGNCRNNGDLHMQAVCLRLADQGNNPEFSWKNIQAKDRKYCNNSASYWNGVGNGCTVAWDQPEVSPIVWIGGGGQSAKDWYLDKANDGNSFAYALMNASPDAPASTKWGPSGGSFYSGWQAQYTGGLISASQLGNFNTGVRHSNYRDQGTNAANGEVAGCLYTTKQPGEGRPAAGRLNYNVDAMSQVSGNLYSGPCDDNPQGDNAGPGGQYPSTLYPILTNDLLFLKAQ